LILLRTNFFIFRLELKETDEFVVIGCDGIWDCLTNEKAVEFVSTRIDDYKPTEIGTMMLNYIISPDPRVTQGIGGDNMTILIIDLQPTKRRWYRSGASETSTTMADNNNINPTSGNNIIQPSPTK
jgi:serine/threonine protein phosphatase PrpC